VRLVAQPGHRILNETERIPALERVTRGRLNSEVRRDSANHYRFDSAAAKLKIELRPVKGAPLPLRDHDVLRVAAQVRRNFVPARLGSRGRRRLVGRRSKAITAIG
jgi:hypothetical protein